LAAEPVQTPRIWRDVQFDAKAVVPFAEMVEGLYCLLISFI
jgi:hypothetical protein